MISLILVGLGLSIITGQQIYKLQIKVKDLEDSLNTVREHVGLSTDDRLDSAVKLIKANRIEEAVALLKQPSKTITLHT